MKRLCLALLFTVIVVAPGSAQRLPDRVVPEHYDVTFTPDFETDDFRGEETITVRLAAPASSVILNAAEIEFQEVTITSAGRMQPATVALDAEHETATLSVGERLAAGRATIHIRFAGQLNDKLRGFYLSKANNRKYAVTQFEATDARRAFPCFDEPSLKATFAITLTIDERDTAISNGRILADTPGPGAGQHTLTFESSPKMSSYLVAMVVGDFECREGGVDGIAIRICSTPDKKALTGFALEAAERDVRFFNDYFGIKYPFGKLDVIAVPDFAAGAMENTAAITFREELLLADPATASLAEKKAIAAVLSHEIAHMWFGDLVTMTWWDDIWLNEGFATWMANKPLRAWKPEWKTELDDAGENQTALTVDALQSTRAIRAKMETPEEINQAFDPIAYQKGASVLRMLEQFVGADVFRRGVGAYLKKYSYSNATSSDFSTEIARASDKPVNEIVATFVTQPGAPLVSVESTCDGQRTIVHAAQQRFFADPVLMQEESSPVWRVPICMKARGGASPACEVLTGPTQTFTLHGCSPWVFVNAGAKGYYRTAYASDALQKIATDVETALTPAERISLLGDEWAVVRTGRHGIGSYLTLAEGLAQDPTAAVVQALAARLQFVEEDLIEDGNREQYRAWIRQQFTPAARTLGWTPAPDETEERRALRATVLTLLGKTGRDPEVLRQARAVADQYMKDPKSVDPALADAALPVAAIAADAAVYEQYMAHVESAQSPLEYYRYLGALSDFTDPALVQRTLDFAVSTDVRTQDAPRIIAALLAEPASREAAWTFVKTHWDELEQRLGTFQGIPLIVGSTGAFCDPSSREDVRRFFEGHKVPAAERSLRQALEGINNCVGVRSRQAERLSEWLKRRAH